jgi:hypothetical protein
MELAGAETLVDALFGQKKIAFLRRFLQFRDGTPSHDRLGDIAESGHGNAFPKTARMLCRNARRAVIPRVGLWNWEQQSWPLALAGRDRCDAL